jgi:phosphatidylglycerol:prolipoprotein diacylglycerol transferase
LSETPVWLLIVSLTVSAALIWSFLRAAKWGVVQSQAIDLAIVLSAGMALGGRLLHVIYEQPRYYLENPVRIFFVWEGGFVFYGGLLTSLALGWWWCQKRDQNFWRWGDFFAPLISFTYAAGRIGCFVNGCCYGRACDLPWGVEHSSHAQWGLEIVKRHPTQLYAAGLEFAALAFLLWYERKSRPLGAVFSLWLGLHGAGRIVMEYFRDDFRGASPLGLSLAVWVSVILILVSLYRLVLKRPTLSN